MHKKILEHIESGNAREALRTMFSLRLRDDIYFDAIKITGHLNRMEGYYFKGLIPIEILERSKSFVSEFIMRSLPLVKKK